MTEAVRSEAQRAEMNGLYARLRNRASASFLHDGLIHQGCPKEVVVAYVAARADGVDPVLAIARAWFGAIGPTLVLELPGGLLAHAARGWAWRLAQVEAEVSQAAA